MVSTAPAREKGNNHEELLLTTEKVRQGETSGHVRLMLAASLSSTVIALATVYFIFFG